MQQSLLKIIWDVALISCCRVPESTAVIIQVLNHDNIKHVWFYLGSLNVCVSSLVGSDRLWLNQTIRAEHHILNRLLIKGNKKNFKKQIKTVDWLENKLSQSWKQGCSWDPRNNMFSVCLTTASRCQYKPVFVSFASELISLLGQQSQ